MTSIEKSPRALLVPMKTQGHWTPFVHLMRALAAHGINLTVCLTKIRADELRILLEKGEFENVDVEIVEVFRDTTHIPNTTRTVDRMVEDFEEYKDKLALLMPTVSCVIVDMFVGVVCVDFADEWRIPMYNFVTSACAFTFCLLHTPTLLDENWSYSNPAKSNSHINLPGLEMFTGADIPETIAKTPTLYRKHSDAFKRSAAVIINSFEEYDGKQQNILTQQLELHVQPGRVKPKVYPIGPLRLVGTSRLDEKQSIPTVTHECIEWLNRQANSSVLFICFGSVLPLAAALRSAFIEALGSTGTRFLWALRLAEGDHEAEAVVEDFESRTRDRGLVVRSWVPQEEVLQHPAVHGFLSHCGWNSIMEAIQGGIPIVACPMYAEQALNARFIVEESKIAILIAHKGQVGDVDGQEVTKAIRLFMDDERRQSLRQNILRLKEAANATVAEGGSSHQHLKNLVAAISKSVNGEPSQT
ncbi:protein MpUGT24 [Marchantia polymorpha subsp. ruderalis]|uniref:Glycosyltransferase n=2 Tax=Marchantia polymorpha TaxID=3197 RepID=A0AAF6BKC0_MARPO|nr:hypothetical protein MARPO_0190s0017 [Marchantia polymorpha]BBN12454.1 hypothetical protein Mp_5g20210 [Marchantia polymorpha subsp. ruderalis]|eukprot:PTQ27622.1 hypothetical protein MARPO_0190s0017 [Marchantia polymorpha]